MLSFEIEKYNLRNVVYVYFLERGITLNTCHVSNNKHATYFKLLVLLRV